MNGTAPTRVIILGGGFGGIAAAQALAKQFKRDRSVEVTLINRDNYMVFVPMLASAAAGSIETLHAVAPIRQLIPHTNFRAEEVIGIDVQQRLVTTSSATTGRERTLPYDHLVIALGNVINLSRLPGVAQHGKTIKTLGDALAIRNHVLEMLEAADIETDPQVRAEMLTFVIAGGGFSGVEMVGELNDMVREAVRSYPSITRDQYKVILLHSNQRILPEMTPEIADDALKELRKRGVEVRLGVRLAGATPSEAVLEGGRKIPTRTLIVAVGNAPPPVLESLAVKKDRGKIVVDEFMRVAEHPGVWALGDNAIVPNQSAKNGQPSPPTAQFALRQGKQLGQNIAATLRGGKLAPFSFGGLGMLCLVGHGAGVGELPFGIRVKGLIGWFLWRSVYWSKMPSLGRKIQIGVGWFLDLFLSRDLAQINLSRSQTIAHAHYEAGEYIFRQGDAGDQFYMVTAGEVEVVRERSSGAQDVLARLGKGEYFGETALLARRRRNASVRSVTAVDVISLSRDDFATLSSTWLQIGSHVRESSDERVAAIPHTAFFSAVNALQAPASAAGMASGGVAHLQRRDSGGEVALDRDLVSLGRSPENNIVLTGTTASRRHALIQREGADYWLEDLGGTNGTWLNGQRLAERTRLTNDDLVRIGDTEFVFRAPQPGDLAPMVPSAPPRLVGWLARASTGEEIELSADMTGLGRGRDNQVIVADSQASRRHALIQRQQDGYWIEDLGGPNGTVLNGQRIAAPTALRDNDEIEIGSTHFTFHLRPTARRQTHDQDLRSLTGIIRELDAPPGGGRSAPRTQVGELTGIIRELDAPQSRPPAEQQPASLTGIIRGLDKPATPGAPAQTGGLTDVIRGLDKPAAPTTPATPVPPQSGGLTDVIRGLDAPRTPSAPPIAAAPGGLTDVIRSLDAPKPPSSPPGPEPGGLTDVIRGLDAPKAPSSPPAAEPGGLTDVIRGLDAPKAAAPPAAPESGGLTDVIRGLDAPKAAAPPSPVAEPGGVTDLIRGLDAPRAGTPQPSAPAPQPGGLTDAIRGLDAPAVPPPPQPSAPPASSGGITDLIRSLDAPAGPAAPADAGTLAGADRVAPLPRLRLEVTEGPLQGSVLEVGPRGASLGRAADNSIRIVDEQMSRHHASIEHRDGAYWLSDLGGVNGTLVNNQRLTAPRHLQSGDVVELGATRLIVTLDPPSG